eukprot:Gb_21229 [translate_table: standard]
MLQDNHQTVRAEKGSSPHCPKLIIHFGLCCLNYTAVELGLSSKVLLPPMELSSEFKGSSSVQVGVRMLCPQEATPVWSTDFINNFRIICSSPVPRRIDHAILFPQFLLEPIDLSLLPIQISNSCTALRSGEDKPASPLSPSKRVDRCPSFDCRERHWSIDEISTESKGRLLIQAF